MSHRLVFESTWIPALLVLCSFSASYTYTSHTRTNLTQPETSRHRKISNKSKEKEVVRNQDMAETLRIGRRGPVSNDSSKPCFAFRRQGSCKFGHRCRFSHDGIGQQRVSGPQPSNNGFNPARDGKLRQWKRLLEMGEGGSQSLELTTSAVGRFFQLGLELMDGDVGAAQEAIKLLATESGLAFIKAMADRHIPAAGDQASRITLWGTEVKPLFALITHPCVVDSAVLEQQVALVFNFILGVGGSRMIRVFTYITWLVKPCSTSSQNEPSQMATVELSLAVLSKVFDCNTNNIIHPEFAKLVSQFAKVVQHTSNPEGEFSRLQASKYLDYMQQRLRAGEEIPDLQSGPHVPITRDTFVLRRDLPGRLSADGPRHDNDHADINKIKIMPTYDEIMSPRGEYLPTNNPSEWHTQGIRGRLDREFRLVREDTVGQLRDAVREMLEFARNSDKNKSRGSNNSLRTYTYEYPTTIDVNLHRIGGLEMVVRCFQPPAVRKMVAKKRKDWWIQSKRLQAGALVCLFDVTGSMLFCVVSDTTMRCQDDKEARRINNDEEDGTPMTQKPLTLSDDETYLFVNLKLVDAGRTEITQAMRWYRNVGASPRRYLVEFPGVLLDSFKHTLSALQQVHEKPSIPFKALLASSESSSSEIEIEPPQYARQAGFTFNLSCLTNDNAPFTMDPRRPPTPDVLASQSTLDPTQSAALLNTLSRELSLIQGPPGTGKSYTGEKIVKVLLNSKKQAKLGPILCVCYTNHALDQLLEHLLDDGTNSIIRIGSRSKSERLQGLNLRTVVKEMLQTKSEKSGLWEAEQQIREYVRQGKDLLEELSSCESWTTVKTLLASEYHRQHAELFGEEEDGWQRVIHQPEMVIDRWLQGGSDIVRPPRPLENLKFAQLQNMTNDERRLLHRHWLKTIRDSIITNLTKLNENYNKAVKHRDEIRGDVDLRCLHMADVVGVTTTGLARNLDLLRKLRCKVMLCEEAGEVLEAHILTALLPSVEHAILIGDHLQLRPQIQNYDLQSTNPRGRQYSLDMSLFERLVQPPHETDLRVPYSVLETQRRMHPLIAELVRATLYPSLQDAETVQGYPEVVGMRQRLFWFHHNQPENAGENDLLSTSQSNGFEVEMTAALVSHLSQQGIYAPGEIAVITPYLGQLQLLRRRMETMFEVCVNERDLDELDTLQAESSSTPPSASLVSKTTLLKSVRVATVDNFQGEEAKVVVVSLVRTPCAAPCDWVPCSLRCDKILDCGHQCPSLCGEICPTPTYCQQCAPDNIKLVCVDFLEMKEYHEVDLNEEPCVFPDCGHFLTVSSMDGQMEMAMHYELDENGLPTSILGSSKPFSMDNKGVKVCAICRGPLRNISRYGRIVRRAMLDEATKKFISWSNAEYLSLAGGLLVEQEKLSSMGPTALRAGNADATGNLTLPSSRQRQLERLKDYVTTRRYDAIIKFRNRVQSYAKKVRKDEQPFQRVAELVRHTNLHHGTGSEFRYDQAIIQVKGSLLASTLLLKCDVLILSDFVGLLLHQRSEVTKPDVKLNLSGFLLDCESLIQLAHSTVYPREEAQGHIFCAQLCALSRSIAPSPPPQAIATQAPTELPLSTTAKKPATLDELRELGLGHVKQARKLLDDNPSIDALKGDIDAVEETLNGGVYRPVTAEELREVYMASTGELSGTGHWYTCQNGHPFTINNCGMAMEEAACPECGARIGGRNHVSVEGVRHAAEIEEMAREMGGVRL
ncbi:hypothetical protein BHE90_004938 [Fusarium euwallaceae]|uniref:Uncharacterized protein n=1 Tax=Fusarium euwallaceae TaxID=1147111 RepID=A0A430LXU6_9HYPO|nr:hypothetical protein BHE90_004938 [Fusarium euwallaceae]